MREFTKHILTALKEDEWEIRDEFVRHVKSRLVIRTTSMQPYDTPYKFTWLERKVIGRYVNKLQERMMLAKFIEYRIAPKKPTTYSHDAPKKPTTYSHEDRFI